MLERDYPESAYDEYLCIKPPILMWIIIAFLFRPFIILIASITNKADRIGLLNTIYPDRSAAFLGAVASIPAIFLLIAWFRKQPGANILIRRFWHHGKALLISSLSLNLLILLWHEIESVNSIQNIGPITMVQFAFCVFSIYYLLRSQRLTDAFSDFPGEN